MSAGGVSATGATTLDMPLAARVAGFVAHLRHNGIEAGPAETDAALRVLARGAAPTLDEARRRLKILLTGRRGEWQRFDDLFEAYWLAPRAGTHAPGVHRTGSGRNALAGHVEPVGRARRRGRRGPIASPGGRRRRHRRRKGRGGQEHAGFARGVSATCNRTHDLRHVVDPEEMKLATEVACRLARALRYRLSRRRRIAPRGARIDLRRTIRRSLAHGGEPFTLIRRRRPERPVRIVLLLDVSGSMQPYARYLLQFVRGSSWGGTGPTPTCSIPGSCASPTYCAKRMPCSR